MNPPKSRENSITRYYIAEENLVGSVKERKADYDLMAAVMICLGKEGDSGTDLLKLLNVLLSTETGSQDKCQILEEDFHIKMTLALESEVSLMCNLSKGGGGYSGRFVSLPKEVQLDILNRTLYE